MAHTTILMLFTLAVLFATTNGFFLYSSSKKPADTRSTGQWSTRDGQPGYPNPWLAQPYSFDAPMTVALPVAVPVQAQMSAAATTLQGTIHNVQLVPCLCPVTKDPVETQPGSQPPPGQGYVVQNQPPPPSQ